MQQLARVQRGDTSIPAFVNDGELLDLRPLVSDITPETIASGVLSKVNGSALKPMTGEVRYLAPIQGIRQIPATGFNYKKHIEEMKVPTPTEPEVFLIAGKTVLFTDATNSIGAEIAVTQARRHARLSTIERQSGETRFSLSTVTDPRRPGHNFVPSRPARAASPRTALQVYRTPTAAASLLRWCSAVP